MKRTTGIAAAVIGLLVVLGVAAAVYMSIRGGGVVSTITGLGADLRDYVAKQVVAIVNTHLEPSLAFETIDYDAPGTVTLTSATLTADDGTRVIDVSTLVITLAEVPQRGEPIKIERIAVQGGSVNLVADPGTRRIRGLVPFVKRGGAATAADPDVPEQNVRLSNVFVLRTLEIEGVDVSIDDGSGAPPMVIEGFTTTMNVAPGAGDGGEDAPEGPGWYAIEIGSGRSPGLRIDMAGWFNIDTLTADVRTGEARVWLDEGTIGSLPPRLADLAREHEALGDLRATFSGEASVRDLANARGSLDASLDGFSIAAGDRRLPVRRIDLRASVAQGTGRLERFDAQTIGGTITASGAVNLLADGLPGELNSTFEGLDLEKLLRHTTPEGEGPELAGIMHGRVGATFNAADPAGTVSGDGEIHVREGVLVTTPGLKQLAQVAEVATFGQARERSHTADIQFTLEPGRAVVTKSEIVTQSIAARGTGPIGFDQTLDLKVNAGPLEKLQNMLGKVGDLLGKVTDQLATYRVRGTLSDPEVSVQPLGIGG